MKSFLRSRETSSVKCVQTFDGRVCMSLQTTQNQNVDADSEPEVGNIILDEGVCEHEQNWKEAKSKDSEAVQHSILTTACLHKKERVWSASTVSMSTC